MILPYKSKLRYIANNPSGELIYILSRRIKYYRLKKQRKNRL